MRLPTVVFPCNEPVTRCGDVLHCGRCDHDLVSWLELSPPEQETFMERIRAGERVCIDFPASEAKPEDDWSDVWSENEGESGCS